MQHGWASLQRGLLKGERKGKRVLMRRRHFYCVSSSLSPKSSTVTHAKLCLLAPAPSPAQSLPWAGQWAQVLLTSELVVRAGGVPIPAALQLLTPQAVSH